MQLGICVAANEGTVTFFLLLLLLPLLLLPFSSLFSSLSLLFCKIVTYNAQNGRKKGVLSKSVCDRSVEALKHYLWWPVVVEVEKGGKKEVSQRRFLFFSLPLLFLSFFCVDFWLNDKKKDDRKNSQKSRVNKSGGKGQKRRGKRKEKGGGVVVYFSFFFSSPHLFFLSFKTLSFFLLFPFRARSS